jgi:hypothetical protein
MPEIAWSDRHATMVASAPAQPRSLQVALSPSGTAILVRQAAASLHDDAETSRFVFGAVSADSIIMREAFFGMAALLFDDARLLVLDSAGRDSLALRALRIQADGRRVMDTLWTRKTVATRDPELFVDRARERWSIAGRNATGEELVIASGSFASESITVRRAPIDESMTQVLSVFGNGTALVPELAHAAPESATSAWLAMLGTFTLRWNVLRIGSERQTVGTLSGFPSCGSSLSDDWALCTEIAGLKRSRIWRVGATAGLALVGALPAGYDISHTEDGTRVTGVARMTSRVALVNVGSRSGVRIRIPEEGLSSSHRWALDASSSADRVAVLSAGRGGTRVTIYRID